MNFSDVADLGSVLTAAAAIFAVFQLVGARTQRHRDFENLYVQRYWQLLDRMPDRLYLNHEIPAPDPDERRIVVAYLRLCEDEVDLRKQGFITDRTWAIWSEGILAQLQGAVYTKALVEHCHLLPSLTQFAHMRKDPLSWNAFARWWSGLY